MTASNTRNPTQPLAQPRPTRKRASLDFAEALRAEWPSFRWLIPA